VSWFQLCLDANFGWGFLDRKQLGWSRHSETPDCISQSKVSRDINSIRRNRYQRRENFST